MLRLCGDAVLALRPTWQQCFRTTRLFAGEARHIYSGILGAMHDGDAHIRLPSQAVRQVDAAADRWLRSQPRERDLRRSIAVLAMLLH